jgi:GntR family transcriptional regulator, vanillate catabolism transcriptional regulator
MMQARLPEAQTMFTVAQDHHRCIMRAIEAREGRQTRGLLPGSNLITFLSQAAAGE